VACKKVYRMIVVRKRLAADRGQMRLFEEDRYFFYCQFAEYLYSILGILLLEKPGFSG